MYPRTLEKRIEQYPFRGRVVTLLGARRTGKTTLVKALLEKYPDKRTRYLNSDISRRDAATQGKRSISRRDV